VSAVVLVLGGTRSGKSALAERLAAEAAARQTAAGQSGDVTYLATARVDPDDAEHAARIARHRARRPATWRTIECPDPAQLTAVLAEVGGVVLVDSLGTWVANHPGLDADPAPLVAVLSDRPAPTIVVSEEVGLAVHPETAAGRRYVDAMGELNQAVAGIAHRVVLVVAGRTLDLPAC
jgi:adenosyl cobinamide kinase/adenosyl cobinamide phosphate guanylyltransferase